jgi:hypothetical protein
VTSFGSNLITVTEEENINGNALKAVTYCDVYIASSASSSLKRRQSSTMAGQRWKTIVTPCDNQADPEDDSNNYAYGAGSALLEICIEVAMGILLWLLKSSFQQKEQKVRMGMRVQVAQMSARVSGGGRGVS